LKRQGEGLPLIAPVRKKTIKLLKNGLVALITFLLTLENINRKKTAVFSIVISVHWKRTLLQPIYSRTENYLLSPISHDISYNASYLHET